MLRQLFLIALSWQKYLFVIVDDLQADSYEQISLHVKNRSSKHVWQIHIMDQCKYLVIESLSTNQLVNDLLVINTSFLNHFATSSVSIRKLILVIISTTHLHDIVVN